MQDWFQHDCSKESEKGLLHNRVAHWWDASQICGSSEEEEASVRLNNDEIHPDQNNESDYGKNCAPLGATSLSHHWVLTYPEINSDQKYGAYSTPFCVFLQSLLRFIHTLEWTPKRYQSIASCIYVCIVLLILILAEYYILRIIIKLGRGVCVRYDTTDGSSILDTADAATATATATATNNKSIVNCDLQYGRRFDIGTMHRTVFVQFQLRQYSEKVFFCLLLSFFLFYLVYFTLLYFTFFFRFRFGFCSL